MRKILAYLNKVTFGLLSPDMATFDVDGAAEFSERAGFTYLEYRLSTQVAIYVDGVFFDFARLSRVSLGMSQSLWKLHHHASVILRDLPLDTRSRMRHAEQTHGDIQLRFKDAPAVTLIKDSSCYWLVWGEEQLQDRVELSLTALWLELQDKELQELCRKYWPT